MYVSLGNLKNRVKQEKEAQPAYLSKIIPEDWISELKAGDVTFREMPLTSRSI